MFFEGGVESGIYFLLCFLIGFYLGSGMSECERRNWCYYLIIYFLLVKIVFNIEMKFIGLVWNSFFILEIRVVIWLLSFLE